MSRSPATVAWWLTVALFGAAAAQASAQEDALLRAPQASLVLPRDSRPERSFDPSIVRSLQDDFLARPEAPACAAAPEGPAGVADFLYPRWLGRALGVEAPEAELAAARRAAARPVDPHALAPEGEDEDPARREGVLPSGNGRLAASELPFDADVPAWFLAPPSDSSGWIRFDICQPDPLDPRNYRTRRRPTDR